MNRGAEQGDPVGPIYCAVVLTLVLDRAKSKLDSTGINITDVWYMDDGQVVCEPGDVEPVLRAINDEASKVGLARGRETGVKTVFSLIGLTEYVSVFFFSSVL